MWMSDARVICAVWGCARCLWFVCVFACLFGLSVCFRKSMAPLCLQCGVHSRPSVLLLFTSVCSPFVNGTIPSLELPHTLCTVRTLFTQGSFVYVSSSHFVFPCISCIFYIQYQVSASEKK